MADDAAPSAAEGQAGGGTAQPSTEAAPSGDVGQGTNASSGDGTSGTPRVDSTSQDDQTFFDPKSVPKELTPAYKQMQAAFTKRMQALSQDRQKVQFFDQFSADPVGSMQKLAQQYGFKMTRAQAEAAASQASDDIPDDWQPQSWKEVLNKAEVRAAQKIFGQLQPLLSEVKNQKKATIEKELSDIDPAWQQYEQQMADWIQRVPGLANYPSELYRLSVPAEVIESRATQRALKKLQDKATAAAVQGGSTTNKKPSAVDPNKRFSSVQEAAAWAKAKLEEDGIAAPKR